MREGREEVTVAGVCVMLGPRPSAILVTSGTLMYSNHRNPSGLLKYCTWNRTDLKLKWHSLVLPRLPPIEGRHSLKPIVHPCEGQHHWGEPREGQMMY